MRKIPLFLFLVLTLLLAACGGAATATPAATASPAATAIPSPTPTGTPTPTAPPAQTASVTIQNYAFVPAQLTVERGTRVTWTNRDSLAHTVTGSGLDSPSLGQGQTFGYTFNTAGDFSYICSLHPTMRGQVTVR